MIIPGSHIMLEQFNAVVLAATKQKNDGTTEPAKVLQFKDNNSGFAVSLMFSEQEFESFKQAITGSRIIAAPANTRIIS